MDHPPRARGAGAPAAPDFATLYGELGPATHRYLCRLIGREDAEDLAQEVFAKVARALPQFKQESKPSTWVYRIATNVAFDWLRRKVPDREARSSLEGQRAIEPPSSA